ncbi:hypothetical protein GXB78_17390 [Pseudomonas moraviensis subsp. stanleyae]|uniref:hypothetical protein n=1 Tax=Pseudomonas moraviensis TaxID=321662 RepID=UPI002E322A91|nr:hypothetical protein [Pseudomonas moraviensis]MED7668980.1 hypothetical protein [Pseudomonas moraviensis subsp. stanleyae]
MSDDFAIKQVSGLKCVHLSKTERLELDCFIGHYIKTRNLHSVPDIERTLRSTLEGYPGHAPVMVNELNAWIDRTLGYRATYPDFTQLEDL